MIGIIGAMTREITKIREEMEDSRIDQFGWLEFSVGKFAGHDIVLCVSGIGKVAAAITAQIMILNYHVKLIVNTGVGGNLTKQLKIGDIAIAEKFVQHDVDTSSVGDPVGFISEINMTYFKADPYSVKLISEACNNLGFNNAVGVIATGDQFVSSEILKKKIIDNFNGIACDMEGGAIAQTCWMNNVPFAAIRAISDDADGSSASDYDEFTIKSAEKSVDVLREFLPKYIEK